MELYQISRYQNIADRLKRLSSPPSVISVGLKGQTVRQKQKTFQDRKDSASQAWKSKYTQASYSKHSMIDVEKEPATYTYIQDHLISPRECRPSERAISSKYRESQMPISRVEKDIKQVRRDELMESKKSLGKVRSDGNIKIDQILESFNNYKQNKEKFLNHLNRQLPSCSYQEPKQGSKNIDQSKVRESKYSRQNGLFLEIDNIWNSTQDQTNDSAPRFERSFTRKKQFQLINDVFSTNITQPTERTKNFSQSKLILKNIVKQTGTQNSQIPALKSIMSPRGPRVPGKICKNNDKTFTAFTRS